MINWVVFDLGDVVLKGTEAFAELAGLLSVQQDRFTDAYFAHRRDYDLHTDPTIFWTSVAIGSGAPVPETGLIAELVRADNLGWSATDPDMLLLIDDLAADRTAMAVLSNAPSSMGRLIETELWAAPFAHLLFSGDLGVIKPDPEIYRELLGRLDAAPAEVAFLDDRPENIAGAIEAGIRGLLFTGAAKARADLRAIGLCV